MFEEILEMLTGRWGIAALLLFGFPGGRKLTRRLAKGVVRAGITATEQVKGLVAEVREDVGDMMAEVKSEKVKSEKHK